MNDSNHDRDNIVSMIYWLKKKKKSIRDAAPLEKRRGVVQKQKKFVQGTNWKKIPALQGNQKKGQWDILHSLWKTCLQ